MAEKTCKELVRDSFNSRMATIRELWKAGYGVPLEDGTKLEEYGLCIDFVPARTFEGQLEGYWRYQLSWGGPQEEFRVFNTNKRVEFWYLDWGDGVFIRVPAKDTKIIREIVKNRSINS